MKNKLYVLSPFMVIVLTLFFLSACEENSDEELSLSKANYIEFKSQYLKSLTIIGDDLVKSNSNFGDRERLTEIVEDNFDQYIVGINAPTRGHSLSLKLPAYSSIPTFEASQAPLTIAPPRFLP